MSTHEPTAIDPRAGSYAPPYPTGWYRLTNSRSLARGKAIRVDAFGKSLVVWRGESGQAYAADAYCPHQGAHLAGGPVDGEGIRCPFHHWRFNGNGQLDDIPGLDRLPRSRVCTHPVQESHGCVWMWHDASGVRKKAA